ncbi:hypothetical protein MAR_008097 [Mya arenaria]|uniref:Uncharacterized protein n=1 Tax=Mya arenaria TaxID=6604 RepID=A0ABY7DWX7_MYAAR|nr:hypothetical protein MAR_008097 [Mya arenaria]
MITFPHPVIVLSRTFYYMIYVVCGFVKFCFFSVEQNLSNMSYCCHHLFIVIQKRQFEHNATLPSTVKFCLRNHGTLDILLKFSVSLSNYRNFPGYQAEIITIVSMATFQMNYNQRDGRGTKTPYCNFGFIFKTNVVVFYAENIAASHTVQ